MSEQVLAKSAAVGYSGTPLPKKLGLKDGQRVIFLNLPDTQSDLATAREFEVCHQGGWADLAEMGAGFDVVHGFTKSRAELEGATSILRNAIRADGMVWISWPKKASKIVTDVSEDVVREVLLPTGLVDIKVCAIDTTWSGLKLVIRKELR